MNPWALFAGACVAIVLVPVAVVTLAALMAAGDADRAAERDEVGVGEGR